MPWSLPHSKRVSPVLWLAATALCALALALCGCGGSPGPAPALPRVADPPPPGTFSGKESFEYLARIQSFGPRIPGTAGSRNAARYCREVMVRYGASASEQAFKTFDSSEGKSYAMRNLFFRFRPDLAPRVLLGTHYDTRRWADLDPDPANRLLPVPGANDGGSGVALFLALARVLAEHPPPVGVDVVLFDGEDFGRAGSDQYCRGSEHFAAHPPSFAERVQAAVILDLVGDRDLGIYQEGLSRDFAPDLVDRFWASASAAGARDVFHHGVKYRIRDDHEPLHRVLSIPSILVIDFDYEGVFHTVEDRLDMCSAQSLQKVGDTVVHFLYTFPAWERRP